MLRFTVKEKVSFAGRAGGGRHNPLVDELIEAHKAGKLSADNGVMITAKELVDVIGGKVEKVTPSNIVYSFSKREGVRMGYRRALNEKGEAGFWLFVKTE